MTPPPITGSTHPLPFLSLSPCDFERLCLWLVQREGYENAELLGEAGSEQGRDILAWRDGRRFAFQCKRTSKFSAQDGRKEVAKIRSLPIEEQPDELVFLIVCAVRAATRKAIGEAWGFETTCHFLVGSELDERVKRHSDILEEFFQLPPFNRVGTKQAEPKLVFDELGRPPEWDSETELILTLNQSYEIINDPPAYWKREYRNSLQIPSNRIGLYDLEIHEDNYFDANHLRFALGNVGAGIVIVSRLWIEVVDSVACTDSFSVGPGAELVEHDYEVLLRPEKRIYTFNDSKIFTYSSGEVDGFLVTMKSSGHYRYKIQVNIEWHSAGEENREVLKSPIYDIRYPYVNDYTRDRLLFKERHHQDKILKITPLLVDGKPNPRLLNIFMFPEHWEHGRLLHVLSHAKPSIVLGEYTSSVESRVLDSGIARDQRIGCITALARLINFDKSALGVFMDKPRKRLGDVYDQIHRIISERFLDSSEDLLLRQVAIELLRDCHYFAEKRMLMLGFVQYQPRLDVQWLHERFVVLRSTLLSGDPQIIELGLRILNGYTGAQAWLKKEGRSQQLSELLDSIDSLSVDLLAWEDLRVLRPALEYCRKRKIATALPRINELAQSSQASIAEMARKVAKELGG